MGQSREPGNSSIKGITLCLGNANSRLRFLPSRGSKYVPCHFIWRVPDLAREEGVQAPPNPRQEEGSGSRDPDKPAPAAPERLSLEGRKHRDLGL